MRWNELFTRKVKGASQAEIDKIAAMRRQVVYEVEEKMKAKEQQKNAQQSPR